MLSALRSVARPTSLMSKLLAVSSLLRRDRLVGPPTILLAEAERTRRAAATMSALWVSWALKVVGPLWMALPLQVLLPAAVWLLLRSTKFCVELPVPPLAMGRM